MAMNEPEPIRSIDTDLRLAIDQIPGVAVLRFDHELRFTSAAGGALARHGIEPCELIGRCPRELGERWAGLEEHFAQALACGRDGRTPLLEWSPDGRTEYAAVISPMLDERGRASGGVFAMRNMAAQRAAEAALAETQAHFRELTEQSADMLTRHEAQGDYTFVSAACSRIYGRDPGELVGRHPLEFVHPDDVEQVRETIAQRFAAGARDFEVEHRVLRPDGSCAWVHASVRNYLDESGRLVGVGTVRDITEQRGAAEALAKAELQARTVIELSGDMHSRTDPQGRYVWASTTSERVIGYSPGELIGHHLRDWAHREDLERFDASHRQALEDGFAQVEYRLRRPDGHYMWVHALLRAHRDEQERVVEVVGAVRDITAQKEQEERLRATEAALAQAEQQARTVIEFSGDLHTRTDADGRLLYVSPNSLQVIGYTPEELLGRTPREFAHPDDLPIFEVAAQTLARTGVAEVEYRVRRPDGSYVPLHVLLRARRDEQGRIVEVVRAARDISAQKEQQERALEARAFERAPVGMALIALDGTWMRVNQAFCRMTGYDERELIAKGFAQLVHPEDLDACAQALAQVAAGQRETHQAEARYLHADGRVIWVAVSTSLVSDEHGRPQHFVSQTQDITERHELQERLAYLADHDPLTDLYNRRRFESELEQQVALCRRYGDTAALLMLDLDHFKFVNDALGHRVGDGVIRHLTALLQARLRGSDILARLGGDEFAVILPRVDANAAMHLASELVTRVEENPFMHDGHRYLLSGSVGVVMLDAVSTPEDALVNVDIALYDAKQRGRGRVAIYSPDIRADVLSGLSMSQRLREALSGGGFELHAQPIVEFASGEHAIHELLVRMRGEGGQLIPPGRFLQAAARFGYMPAIDRWVIAEALRLAAAAPGRRLTVNLSAQGVVEPGLVEYISEQLALSGALPADIIFELSESAVIANLDEARGACERLRDAGFGIALDDFGSGFSGFSYLKALQVDLLKIDGQFVRNLPSNDIDRLVVEAILHVAGGMGLPTVAEFVTDADVAEHCQRLGVTFGQGFHLGKPAPLDLPPGSPHSASPLRQPA
jgi:diguanylate cyclase (GGDEF)-like protein/PAS domain S-box-containing protein